MTNRIWGLFYALLAVAGTLAFAEPASAQATRTWVSGVGDDANPCSRTAPCRTIQGTISKTAAGGEINCLDPGGVGAVTITKSITILCDHTTAGILVAGTNGITINAGASDTVVLSGLDFEGIGQGLSAVRIVQAGNVVVRNSTIRGFTTSGILFEPANSGASLTVENVTIVDSAHAIFAYPQHNVAATFSLNNVRVSTNNSVSSGVQAYVAQPGSSLKGTVTNSLFTGARQGISAVSDNPNTPLQLLIKDSVIIGSTDDGLYVAGDTPLVQMSGSKVAHNSIGLRVLGGSLTSYGDNVVVNNGTNGSFTGQGTKK
ncbi:MAG TPA: right-handed parallel beta-helix repeat-containing protein [Sphingopyxis sp.]|nr:right-handed parallel beta-helix repeat-containing protein [Sphingopyxis sp.]HMQ18768.1 right-handed parallel beta-helix repeat-containing protein [Sphingopyxis sp.]